MTKEEKMEEFRDKAKELGSKLFKETGCTYFLAIFDEESQLYSGNECALCSVEAINIWMEEEQLQHTSKKELVN